jgi:multiple sugar transport system permease protein
MVPFQVNLIPLFRIMVSLHQISPVLGVNTYFGLVAPSAIQVFGIFLLRQFIRSIPDEILDCARVDGASEFRILRSIVFPLAVPDWQRLRSSPSSALNDFLWPLLITQMIRCERSRWPGASARRGNNWGDTMAGRRDHFSMIAASVLQTIIKGLTQGATADWMAVPRRR